MLRLVSLVALLLLPHLVAAADWPQWRGPNRDGVWSETGVVTKFADEKLPAKWKAPLAAGYSGPTVAAGKVYVTDHIFGTRETKEAEGVRCFDAATGAKLWEFEYPVVYGKIGYQAGPRASVGVVDNRAYALGATGMLHVFSADKGELLWKKDLDAEYKIEMPIWGVSASPLMVDDLVVLHISGQGACVVALDRKTGEERWKALDDRGQYSSPILIEQAGKKVVLVWTGDGIAGLGAADGKVLWRIEWRPKNMPIGCASPVIHDDRVFFTSFYDGSMLIKLGRDTATAEKLWHLVGPSERQTEALHSIISTPIFDGKYIYGVDSYGELRCLEAETGKRLWENLDAVPKARWSTIHFVKNGDRWFLFNERGDLIIAKLSPQGYEEISRTHIIDPTRDQLPQRGGVVWTHPAFANKCIFIRNDKELVCASLE